MSSVTMTAEYVAQTVTGAWRVAGTRVSLESVVLLYLEGLRPEEIVREFPSLTLEQVHGTIAFYLRNKAAMDAYLAEIEKKWDDLRSECETRNKDLRERIRGRARQAEGETNPP